MTQYINHTLILMLAQLKNLWYGNVIFILLDASEIESVEGKIVNTTL